MVNTPLLVIWLWAALLPKPTSTSFGEPRSEERCAELELFEASGLSGIMDPAPWMAAMERMVEEGQFPRVLAIADMRLPSTEERLYVIDLEARRLLLRTWVAHGQGSGELHATTFSNVEGSHQTSLGLYRVGAEITSPKHGKALLLHGLDSGLNCQALSREVIIHGADYVSSEFIREHGRLGRSWGCPAVAREHMATLIEHLANGGMLFVHH